MVKKYFSGFTLVELLIVFAIIAALAILVLVSFSGQIFKGNDAKRKGDLDRLKIAVEEYEKDHNCYPKRDIVYCKPTGKSLQPYIDKIPCDPITNASYYYEVNDESSDCPVWFRIYTVLQNTQDTSATPGIGPQGAFNYVVGSANAPVNIPLIGATPTSAPGPTATPGPTSPSGPTPTPASQDNFYGCKSLTCVPISWDQARPGPECDPNYQSSSCYEKCATPGNECVSWR